MTKELRFILAMVWYFKIELIRTKQLPEYVTISQIDKIPSLIQDIKKQALLTYNMVFRDCDQSKIIILDTGREEIDGKAGMIDCYDPSQSKFKVMVSRRRGRDSEGTLPYLVSSENMNHVHEIHECYYNADPKQSSSMVTLADHFPTSNMDPPCLKIEYDVFCAIQLRYSNDAMRSNHVQEEIVTLLNVREKQAREDQAKIESEQRRLQDGLCLLHATHEPVTQRPRKRSKNDNRNGKNPFWSTAVNAHWRAKVEHYLSMQRTAFNANIQMDHASDDDSEHVFTYPFSTIDNSLRECSDELFPFNAQQSKLTMHDSMFSGKNTPTTIIVNAASVQSMSSGCAFDNNIMDFCLSW